VSVAVGIDVRYGLFVRLFVFCLSVRSISKKNDPSVQTWLENDLGILEVICFWGYKVKGQGHRVNKSILHSRTAIH